MNLRQFILKTGLYLLLFTLPLMALECLLRRPVADPYALKRHLLERNAADLEVLIVGNSLAWSGLNPNRIHERCVNVANFNQAFYHDFEILEKYLPLCKNLKTVVLPLSCASFYGKPTERSDQYYSAYWGFPPFEGKKKEEHYSALMAYGLMPGVQQLLFEREKPENKGWGGSEVVYDGNEAFAQSRLKDLHTPLAEEHFKTCADYFNKIVRLCEDRKMRLICFLPPFSQPMNRLLEGEIWHQKMLEYLQDYAAEQPLECYDFNDEALFNADCFLDPDHLNTKGANLLSDQMKALLERPSAARRLGQRVSETNH